MKIFISKRNFKLFYKKQLANSFINETGHFSATLFSKTQNSRIKSRWFNLLKAKIDNVLHDTLLFYSRKVVKIQKLKHEKNKKGDSQNENERRIEIHLLATFLERLPNTEHEIFIQLLSGSTPAEIANKAGGTAKTIARQLKGIHKRLLWHSQKNDKTIFYVNDRIK